MILLPISLLVACDDFLDVSSDDEILQKEIFSDGSGVRLAVNGVYKALSSNSLYGKNLTWGFISVLGHNYADESLPFGWEDYAKYEWKSSSCKTVAEEIWTTGYNVIASCNNIIQEIEKKDSSFFEYGAMEKDMILGEMYGLRAFVHFDIYRLFVPAPATNYTGNAIPYVTVYPDHQPKHLDAKKVMELIVTDMTTAKKLLAKVDTVFCRSWNRSSTSRLKLTILGSGPDNFVGFRGHRMNYFAAAALLARMYLYAGDYQQAYANALEAYQFHEHGWFAWTPEDNQGNTPNLIDMHVKRYEELYMAFFNNDNYDNWENAIGTSYQWLLMKNIDKLFGEDLDDFRYKGFYNRHNDGRYLTWQRPTVTSSGSIVRSDIEGPLLPIIRFSEMYHILIECLIEQGKVSDAAELLNTLRTKRGVKFNQIPLTISAGDLKEKLVNDVVRENLTEGRTFFFFKRLNRGIYNGDTNIELTASQWTIPLPDSETSYQ